jgi:hypothetical protein
LERNYTLFDCEKTPENKHLPKSQNHYKYGVSYGPIIDTIVQIFGKDATCDFFLPEVGLAIDDCS